MTTNEKDTFKVRKCIGIPMYPEGYHFDMERPKGITDEHLQDRKNKVDKFFKKKRIHHTQKLLKNYISTIHL